MKRLVTGLILASIALSGPAAFAADKSDNITRGAPWQEAHQNYELKHPLKVTCGEFVTSEVVYRPFIVGYLEGAAHHKHKMEAVEQVYVPISVPSVVEECTTHPDKTVWELIDTNVAAHK